MKKVIYNLYTVKGIKYHEESLYDDYEKVELEHTSIVAKYYKKKYNIKNLNISCYYSTSN